MAVAGHTSSLRLLGGAVVEDEKGPRDDFTQRRHSVALLALLAVAPGGALSRGKLVGLLWPDSPERRGRNRLNTCVHHIRSILGQDVLVSAGEDLRLNAEKLRCDVHEFRQALEAGDTAHAVKLYRGPLLDGFGLKGSPEFEKWVDGERHRLRRKYREALEALAEEAEERGDPEVAARWWRRRANDDPYDSRIAHRLMEALAKAGNHAAALKVAEVHTALLEGELGVAADPAVREAAERLRSEVARDRTSEPDRRPEAAEEEGPPGATEQAVPPRPPRMRDISTETGPLKRVSVAFAGIGLLGAMVVATWHLLGAGAAAAPERPDGVVGSVAVLPFATVGEREATPFTRGIQIGVLTRLANIPELAVLSEQSVERLGELQESTRTVAARFGVDWIVRGDVQEVGSRVQVNVRLADARRDRQVWAETYDAALSAGDLFEVQGQIAAEIARALQVRLTPDEGQRLASVPTESTVAYELYLQARELGRSRPGPADPDILDAQADLYRRALELDPVFAPAWAWLGLTHLGRAFRERDRAAWIDSAGRAARRALELDPELADGHVSLAFVHLYSGDRDAMIAGLRRALEIQPSNPAASRNLAVAVAREGRIAEAVRLNERGHRRSPTERGHILALAERNELLGRREVSEAWLAIARERGHSTLLAEAHRDLFHRGDLERARALLDSLANGEEGVAVTRRRAALALYERDWPEARRLYRSLYPGHPYASSPMFLGMLSDRIGLAWTLRELGDEEQARDIAEEVIRETRHELEAGSHGLPGYLHRRMAVAHLLLGDTTAALDRLEAALPYGVSFIPHMETVPVLEPLRDHPRFRALVETLRARLAEERHRVEEEGWGLPPTWTEGETQVLDLSPR